MRRFRPAQSRNTSQQKVKSGDILFQYSMVFQNCEFGIEITEQGISTWHDRSLERIVAAQIRAKDELLEYLMRGWTSDADLLVPEESRVTVQLDDATMSFIEVAAQMFARGKWERRHEVTLDRILGHVFWEQVNPQLPAPLCRTEVAARACQG